MKYEAVFLFLYDVGRSIDLKAWEGGTPDLPRIAGRDTPASLFLPQPLIWELDNYGPGEPALEGTGFSLVRVRAKIYEEGVVTMECRAEGDFALEELHTLKHRLLKREEGEMTLDSLQVLRFTEVLDRIRGRVVQERQGFQDYEREHYRVFCLLDPVADPQGFLDTHRRYLAPFLLGEDPALELHETQVAQTLKTPFSFRDRDVVIFDLNRAFLIDSARDYEDLLLIVEHANYQLLELRVLDKLLDRWLDEAERDIRSGYDRKRGGRRLRSERTLSRPSLNPLRAFGTLSQKLGNLQPLRLDALFLLENLENSSRIIGDYYLGQIYEHLCRFLNTEGWKRNVEKRLDLLQNIYTLTKADITDRTMVLLELLVVLLIGVELVALFLPWFKP